MMQQHDFTDNGEGVILRLWNSTDRSVTANIRVNKAEFIYRDNGQVPLRRIGAAIVKERTIAEE